jgi:hypothetical protein
VEALESLPSSPLREFIKGSSDECPKLIGKGVGFSENDLKRHTVSLERELNPSQVDAIRMALDQSRPMAMIHGPPGMGVFCVKYFLSHCYFLTGSGKTRTLMALLKLYFVLPPSSSLDTSSVVSLRPVTPEVVTVPAKTTHLPTRREEVIGLMRPRPPPAPTMRLKDVYVSHICLLFKKIMFCHLG